MFAAGHTSDGHITSNRYVPLFIPLLVPRLGVSMLKLTSFLSVRDVILREHLRHSNFV
jgi:hypothetical protein